MIVSYKWIVHTSAHVALPGHHFHPIYSHFPLSPPLAPRRLSNHHWTYATASAFPPTLPPAPSHSFPPHTRNSKHIRNKNGTIACVFRALKSASSSRTFALRRSQSIVSLVRLGCLAGEEAFRPGSSHLCTECWFFFYGLDARLVAVLIPGGSFAFVGEFCT